MRPTQAMCLTLMCEHQPALTCMTAKCSVSANASNPLDIAALSPMLDCVCTACPAYLKIYGQLDTLQANIAGNTNETALMESLCGLVEGFECVSSSQTCAVVLENPVAASLKQTAQPVKPSCERLGYIAQSAQISGAVARRASLGFMLLGRLALFHWRTL